MKKAPYGGINATMLKQPSKEPAWANSKFSKSQVNVPVPSQQAQPKQVSKLAAARTEKQ